MLSIIFQRDGRTDWWKPNQTSLPPPRGLEQPSEGVKNERPTGVYLGHKECVYMNSLALIQILQLHVFK